MTELLGSAEKARRYLSGYWEGEKGWYFTGRPCIADLARWSPPRIYRTWQRQTAHLTRAHPPQVNDGVRAMLYKWVARHHPKWDPGPYLEMLIQDNVRLTTYALDGRIVGVEFNLVSGHRGLGSGESRRRPRHSFDLDQ
jgi:hypothetical protein